MVFIYGINFSERQLVRKAIGSFFGVGPQTATNLMARFHIHPSAKVAELETKQTLDLTAALTDMKIENDLRRSILDDIKRLRDSGTYRGRRHAMGLPVRGQATKGNARMAMKLNKVERKL